LYNESKNTASERSESEECTGGSGKVSERCMDAFEDIFSGTVG